MPERPGKFRIPTKEDFRIFFDPAWTHYVGSMYPPRPGLGLFSSILEYQYFPPGTPKNNDFHIITTAWECESMWLTVSIPTAKKHLAEAVAKYCHLKIMNTYPVCLPSFPPVFASLSRKNFNKQRENDRRWQIFPFNVGINVFTMENLDTHPIRTKEMNIVEWEKHELDAVKLICGKHEWTDEDEDELTRFRAYLKGETDNLN